MINYQSISKQHSPSAITQKVKLHQINSCKILLLLVRRLLIKIKLPFNSFFLFWQYNIIFKLNSNQQNFLFLFFNQRIIALQCCVSFNMNWLQVYIHPLPLVPPHPSSSTTELPQIKAESWHLSLVFFPIALFLASPLCIRLLLSYARIKTETQAWSAQPFDSFSIANYDKHTVQVQEKTEQEIQGLCSTKSPWQWDK